MSKVQSISDKYSVETDAADWPTYTDKAAREWVVAQCRTWLQKFGQPMPLWVITERVFASRPDMPKCLRNVCMYDYMYSVVERALRQIADPVWELRQ